MCIPFGTWPTPKIWSRSNGCLTPCTRAPLARLQLPAETLAFRAVPSTSSTLHPEGFRRAESTSILLPSCARLASEHKRLSPLPFGLCKRGYLFCAHAHLVHVAT